MDFMRVFNLLEVWKPCVFKKKKKKKINHAFEYCILGKNVKTLLDLRFTKWFFIRAIKTWVYLYVAQDTVDDDHFQRCKIKNRKGKMIFFSSSFCSAQEKLWHPIGLNHKVTWATRGTRERSRNYMIKGKRLASSLSAVFVAAMRYHCLLSCLVSSK